MVQTLVVPDPLTDLARLEGVPSGLAAARAAVDVVLTDRGLRAITGDQVAAALLAGARASARLTDDPDRWAAGAIRLSTELPVLAGVLRVAPGQALAGGEEGGGRQQRGDDRPTGADEQGLHAAVDGDPGERHREGEGQDAQQSPPEAGPGCG